jgi:hypothetical protein
MSWQKGRFGCKSRMSKPGIEQINSLFEKTVLCIEVIAHWAKSD